ncbi:Adenine deaminase [Beauveria bassiana]|nr:Adenine deaminase [Beauveria bassiana]KAH8715572.1 Adenine deaminase [Beauveria bassiana]
MADPRSIRPQSKIGKHPREFTSVYGSLSESGVRRLAAHYGEERPAEYVTTAVSHLGVMRIDHGRRAAEDAMLLRQLAKAGTLLTLCPVSNAGLGGVATVQEVPIRDLLEAGVRLSINGDDPAYFGADLSGDYCAVQEALHLSMTGARLLPRVPCKEAGARKSEARANEHDRGHGGKTEEVRC